jgi:CubicO group peptidase (beta-lactamase class C family)
MRRLVTVRAMLHLPMRALSPLLPVLFLLPLHAQDQSAQEPQRSLPAELKQITAAYSAKVAASAVFVSGRTIESVLDQEMAPDAPLQALVRPLLSYEVDREQKTVSATVLGTKVSAAFVDGLGCTIVRGDVATLRARALPPVVTQFDPRAWPVGDAVDAAGMPSGIDGAAIDKALDAAFTDREGRAKARTRAVVVVHKGRIIAERYAPGFSADRPLAGWSMTKSLVNALVGLRVGDGMLDPEAQLPVPEWSAQDDPRRQLRLMDLLRMESGLQWSEDYDDPQSLALRMLFLASDFGGVAAEQQLVHAPRTTHEYSSGTSNLLCRIVRATFDDERSYLSYARDRLFLPIGMKTALLEPDPSGVFVGSSFGFATARDWARFGLLYLRDGVWEGTRILPEGWVATAITPCATSPRGDYGAHLWLNAGKQDDPSKRPFSTLPTDLFYLSGFEGQYVVCFPSHDLVVVRLGCTKKGGFDLHGFLRAVMQACEPSNSQK